LANFKPTKNRAIWSKNSPIAFTDRFPVIEEWIKHCSNSHDECRHYRSPASLPTRLIYIPSHSSFCPRLVETVDLTSMETRYTTLSYRWGDGSNNPLRTLRSNLESFKDEIPLKSLPKTFLDAMSISRGLGIQYIWIDSLCIVQDSRDDWSYEAARMCDVYEGSYLSIAATDAPNADGGCFLESLTSGIHIRHPMENSRALQIRVPGADPDDIAYSTLLKRGW
jgi:hypothetical protein